MKIDQWIRESNLIENIDDPKEDKRSQMAWNWFKDQALTLDIILQLHRKICRRQFKMDKISNSQLGKWRTVEVRVGPRVCIPSVQVPKAMQDWADGWIGEKLTEGDIQNCHVQFERVHPFRDGNGRTGRMIMNWQMVHNGFSTLLIEAKNRWEYYGWFREQ